MTTNPSLSKLMISLKDDIDSFNVQVDQRESAKLFAQAKKMLAHYEIQRAVLFNEGGAYHVNGVRPQSEITLLVKLAAKQTTVLRMIRRYDAENDQVELARQLIIELTVLTLLMNGDGVDKNILFRDGAFYTFTRIKRPVQPLLEIFKNYMISFVRPLHSVDANPEWEVCHFERDWQTIVKEIDWDAVKNN